MKNYFSRRKTRKKQSWYRTLCILLIIILVASIGAMLVQTNFGKVRTMNGLFAAEDDEAGGVVAIGVDAGHQHLQPVQGGRFHAGNGRLGPVAALRHKLCRHGRVGHGRGRQAELLQEGLALGNGLLVAVI